MGTVQIYLLGAEQRAAQYMVEFLRGQVNAAFSTGDLEHGSQFVGSFVRH